MSTSRTINLISRKPALKPVKVVSQTDHIILRDPAAADLKRYTDDGWRVAFESFQMISTSNGIKDRHFVRMEKQVKGSTSLFRP